MYYTQEQIDRANQADLVSFLQSQGERLIRAGNEYRWKRHDSLTIRGNKWYRHSQSKGGGPVDFVMEFFGKSFTEAVEMLTGEKGAALPPDRPSPAPLSDFRLPPRNTDNRTARNYLTAARRIDEDVSGFFFASGDIYEDAAHHNAVFVGRDEDGIPRYAHSKGTAGNFRLDVKGSDKAFNFCYRGEGERLFVFEAPIDLLSFLCLFKKDWQKQSYLALGGVGEKALLRFLSDRPNIKTVYLCLDSDQAGSDACSRLAELVPEGLTVHRLVPLYKDWNEVLQHRAEIADGKYIREAIYGLKEPPQEETVEIIRMSEVDTQTVEWLWEPYIPFGKVTIVQGNPGEGKTTFALRLAAACTTGGTLPGMKPLPPFQVIYQTAEDGLGDTVKPRLIEAEADLDRVLVIDEAKRELTRGALDDLSDKGVIKKFPPCIASTHTALVLKEPKTKTSIRRVYLPKTVAYMLVERKKEIDELMDLFGDEYIDNNLVFCSSNGRPMESQVINRAFNKLIKENGLPHVVFHSLRHSSITYKLKLNGGDMKSVQGDSGHAQVKMVADVYSHIIDEDRCINAQRLEEAFYSSKTPDPVEDTEPKTADTAVTESDESDAAKILELLKNPETAALLKQLAKAL